MQLERQNDMITEERWRNLKIAVRGCIKTLQPGFSEQRNPNGQTGKVLLSYNWSTKELVRQLKQKLNDAGLETWIDDDDILPGSLNDSLEKAIAEAAVVLIC